MAEDQRHERVHQRRVRHRRAPRMVVSRGGRRHFGAARVIPTADLTLHPVRALPPLRLDVLRGPQGAPRVDGVVRIFRPTGTSRGCAAPRTSCSSPSRRPSCSSDDRRAVEANLAEVPAAPGALYLRPMLLGTEPNIGAAASPSRSALLAVVASPVGDYFAGGVRPLTLLVETEVPRTTPQFGEAKAGANYLMALGVTRRARAEHGCDQVLFAPVVQVQETGAANFLLFDEDRVVTRALDSTFLHGVTRDSVLTLARDRGMAVEERDISVDELLAWRGEAALAGTAAVLSGVGTLVHRGARHTVGTGDGRAGHARPCARARPRSSGRGQDVAEDEDRHG
jgi:branched-chain amino acid aminotransferase